MPSMKFTKNIIKAAVFLLLSSACGYSSQSNNEVDREFRGVWIATVGNIDWPSDKGLSAKKQQAEVIKILDTAKNSNLNAIMLQIRPQSDAFYNSKYEPWSEYLTGIQGQNPNYDPLSFWIEEAHKRGIELHGWINPYRANADSISLVDIPNDAVVKLNTTHWLIPTEDAVKAHVLKVIMDVVDNYDFDGIHMDDYFYPYPSECPEEQFPDQAFYESYTTSGGKLSLEEWRRSSVNTFIKDLQKEIKQSKPYLKFGISPFGIWRPGYPKGIEAGVDSFKELAADSKKWINKGWVDYLVPQLYWPIEQTPQSFRTLLDWWIEQNTKNRNIWPGLYTSNEVNKGSTGTAEIVNQINMAREKLPKEKAGHIHFSMEALLANTSGITDTLNKEVYQDIAITPSYSNIQSTPDKAILNYDKENLALKITIPKNTIPQAIVISSLDKNGKWSNQIQPAYDINEYKFNLDNKTTKVAVQILDRYGNLSDKTVLAIV